MKKPAVLLHVLEAGDARLSQSMQLLGFRVEVTHNEKGLVAGLRSAATLDLILLDGRCLVSFNPETGKHLAQWAAKGGTIVLIHADQIDTTAFPYEVLSQPLGPLLLHELSRRYIRSYSRNHPRIDTRLPGLFIVNDQCHFCEILNLGTGGAFIKTGGALPATAEVLDIHVPLLGMHKELELRSRVVYRITPGEDNNYLQGIGVAFELEQEQEKSDMLANYLIHSLDETGCSSFAAVYYPYAQPGSSPDKPPVLHS